MGISDAELTKARLVERLKEMGLTEYESQTLVGLTRLGTATAKDIADVEDVPRTRVYDAIETLHERGLADIQHTTPRKFTIASRETVVSKLDVDRKNSITEIAELLAQLGPVERQTEQMGVWTVRGQGAVSQRVCEFVDDATDQIIFMTVDDLLTEEHIDRLVAAHDRGVDIYLAGISEAVQSRIQDTIPSAEVFDTLWEWQETPAGTLLITDERTALVSARVDGSHAGDPDEVAIWGSGSQNSLVVVLRAIFTWRLDTYTHEGDGRE